MDWKMQLLEVRDLWGLLYANPALMEIYEFRPFL